MSQTGINPDGSMSYNTAIAWIGRLYAVEREAREGTWDDARLMTAWNRVLDANRDPDKALDLDDLSRGLAKGFEQTPQDPLPRSTKYVGLSLSESLPDGLRSLTVEHSLATTTKP